MTTKSHSNKWLGEIEAEIRDSVTAIGRGVAPSFAPMVTNYYPCIARAFAADGETRFPHRYVPHYKHAHRSSGTESWSNLILFHIADAIYHLYQVTLKPEDKDVAARMADCLVILRQLAKAPASYGVAGNQAEGFYLVDPAKAGG